MRSFSLLFLGFIFIITTTSLIFSQTENNQLEAYKQFISQNKNLSPLQLMTMHPAGGFRETIDEPFNSPLYLDSIDTKYELTDDEKILIDRHGFMVSERLSDDSFGQQLLDIYQKDLPVFISTDAVLHAFHSSYDRILKDVELGVLINKLNYLLETAHSALPELANRYSSNENIKQMLRDVDVYLTVPRILLTGTASPYYLENNDMTSELLNYVEQENLVEIYFFSSVRRKIDFSQFKPRGHYDDSNYPELAKYFKAMIWLGRMELYLIAPETAENKPTLEDVQRQSIVATLISELIDIANVEPIYEEIENIITSFVGEQDNVALPNLRSLKEAVNLSHAEELLDTIKFKEFQDSLATKSYAFQKILSQVLMNDPSTPDSIRPASAFMLFGQRFIIDSYVTGNVVFDKVKYNGEFVKRMLPSTLDILFSIGNNAAGQLLEPELNKFHYSSYLAGLRYLVDSHDDEFWNSSIYNSWLDAIRSLNTPEDKSSLPTFMQTAAWWQQKMNTQLSSWTELRHDNLLYAKQSYTGGVTCFFPYSYVEPIPEFYSKMKLLAENSIDKIGIVTFADPNKKAEVIQYFRHFIGVADTLGIIAQKELDGALFTEDEINFLQSMMSYEPMCGGVYNGWYPNLYYPAYDLEEGLLKKDFLVADYHTAPTDEGGGFIGWVAHAGTGPIDMAVITAALPNGENVAFIGPVMSYYEYTTTNFLRLTDNEWKETYLELSLRPDWTNSYLANKEGRLKEPGAMLVTSVEDDQSTGNVIPTSYITAQNYPNPFNNGTIISFSVPQSLSNSLTELTIYNIQGKVVKRLLKEELPFGNYLTRWNGTNEFDNTAASGIYFYEVKVGNERFVGKMNLLK